LSSETVEVEGKPEAWSRVTVGAKKAGFELHPLIFKEGGDKFSKMMLGMVHFFHKAPTPKGTSRKSVLDELASCNMALGVRIHGDSDAEVKYSSMVLSIARYLKGFIFAEGRCLLSAAGECLLGPVPRRLT
jgi:hypothetical protein